ncbi:MAG: TonB-dependent receptor domain-containing protein [Fidelibacterota bacterium]
MRKIKYLSILILICLFGVSFVLPDFIFAGTTGKIAGSVKDKKTGDPLPGVNVVIEGTERGASTDYNGYFFITNMRPGKYTVVFTMMGYNKVVIHNVKVTVDQTAELNVKLEPTVIEFQTIVVEAERPLIDPEITTKSAVITADQIQSMPITESQSLLTLQSGVIEVKGYYNKIAGFETRGIDQTHVRGGRNGEIAYMVDGMYVEDAIYAGMGTIINKEAIQEMTIQLGGFGAEYGEAQAAVVNIITKEGTKDYRGALEYKGSGWADIDGRGGFKPISESDAVRDYHDILGSIGGPIPLLPNLTFFFSGEQAFSRYSVYEFDDITYDSTLITNPADPNYGKRVGDTTRVWYKGRWRKIHPYDSFSGWKGFGFKANWDISSKITWYPFSSLKVMLTHRMTERRFRNYSNSWRYAMQGRHIVTDRTDQEGLTITQQITPRTFYTFNINRFWKYRTYRVHGYHGDVLTPGPREFYNNLTEDVFFYANEPDYPSRQSFRGFYLPLRVAGFDSSRGVRMYSGSATQYWTTNWIQTTGIKGDITSQITDAHEVKTGFEYKKLDIRFLELQYPWIRNPYPVNYLEHPTEASFYIQDKLNFPNVIVNIGGRLDYSNSGGYLWEDPKDPTSKPIEGKDKYQISPRLGVGYPITDKTTFHFNYGHFFQVPEYRNLFLATTGRPGERDPELLRDQLITPRPLIGNPHLNAQKTVSYEFGVRQQLLENWAIDITAWSKSLVGQTGTVNIIGFDQDTTSGREPIGLYNYYVMDNYDHGTARGFDITVDKRFSNYFAGQLNYTYSVAKANRYYSWTGYWSSQTAESEPKKEFLMDYDQTHVFNINGTVQMPKGFGPRILGFKPMQDFLVDFIFYAASGYPYTPSIGGKPAPPNSARIQPSYQLDVLFRKDFPLFKDVEIGFFALVKNLFNRLNPLTVYSSTGSPTDPDPGSTALVTQLDRPDFFGPRRSIDLGIRLIF